MVLFFANPINEVNNDTTACNYLESILENKVRCIIDKHGNKCVHKCIGKIICRSNNVNHKKNGQTVTNIIFENFTL